ncbi:uncharacterized protein LOC132556250 [Ylistrum balloti]|uniref:uncharacterized protein LOC132556250 n=1 Tax=Ylistrum balloti TaxID=509963 RepID=UPI002905E69C|nr:uncharacterized protein LOC132556250 [Ylistrum balloti]
MAFDTPFEGLVFGAEFFMTSVEMGYPEADQYCRENNGTLIAFDTQEKWDNFQLNDLYTSALKDGNFWIGHKYQPTICASTGCFHISDVDWWCTSFPETCGDVDECIHVHQKDGKVHRKGCTDSNQVVCERGVVTTESKTTTTTTTVPSTTTSTAVTTSATPDLTSSTSTETTPTTSSVLLGTSTTESSTLATPTTTVNSMTQEELLDTIQRLRSQLIVRKNSTSLYKRQFISVYESRVSSVVLGSSAIIFLVLAISVIIIPDVINMIKFMVKKKKVSDAECKKCAPYQ